jgi:hypothetical protein
MRIVLAALILAAATLVAHADEPRADSDITQIEGPRLSTETIWVGSTLIMIGGLFLAAAVLGPIIRANNPQEVPPTHSHDEPPGASHHHGPSGTRL